MGAYDVHPEIEANTRAVARALTEAGAVVEEIELPWTRDDLLISLAAHFSTVFGAVVSEIEAKHRDRMSAYAVAFADTMAAVRRQVTYLDGLRVETRLQRDLGEAMAPFDAPICLTTAVPGLPAGDDLLGRLVVNGEDHGEPLWAAMTVPFDINNRCPVLNVPSGRSSGGLPTGLQIVGHTYDGPTVFRIGKAVERLRPWTYTPDHRPAVQ
ncbi:amidase family protein [Streptomyces exfoliatus]|uniref:amidase family protein n=1 Tax=Streptomyces exfoliatus TaxID=1905 RepID=UPI003C2D3EE6